MIKIKTKSDLKLLESCPDISPAYYNLVELYFLQLMEALCPPESDPEQYNLENDGYIVVLECQDDPHNLPQVGLPLGLAESFPGPEWSELHELPDGTKIHLFAYMMDNDYMMFYYFDSHLWRDDQVIQQFLQEQAAYNEIYNREGSDV